MCINLQQCRSWWRGQANDRGGFGWEILNVDQILSQLLLVNIIRFMCAMKWSEAGFDDLGERKKMVKGGSGELGLTR